MGRLIVRRFVAALFALWAGLVPLWLQAQDTRPAVGTTPETEQDFRIEKVPVAGGAEIITIFASLDNDGSPILRNQEMPLVSVLRDTLGDERPENDQLRYVWMLTYTKPSFWQKTTASIPFLYTRTGNKGSVGKGPPPHVTDVRRSTKALWDQISWMIFRKLVLGQFGAGGKAVGSQYRQNLMDYRRSAVAKALTVLSLYESVEGQRVLSDSEMKDIQARLWMTETDLGWHMQDENLHRVYDKKVAEARDLRGHNWELLRQYTEAQGLYFEPMEMADGSARHALVWVAAEDLAANRGRKFDKRFLNFSNPWDDDSLRNWKGYSEVRWYDEENRVVPHDTPGAKPRRMIPLAIYGLDYPKIPIILVDFRNNGNPRKREMTKRILNDVTGNVFSLSQFSGFPFFVGRFLYDFVTARRGMDLNQSSRVRSYSQLKLLLAMDDELNRDLRRDISGRIEKVSLNPLENDLAAEVRIARAQYRNLMSYAARSDGLPAKLDRDRRNEMVKFAHGAKQQLLYKVANVVTFGLYSHREKATPAMVALMDRRRQLDYHERVLREVAFKSAQPEVDSNVAALRRSLIFMSENGSTAQEKTSRALAKIFAVALDDELRTLCLTGLYRINNSAAKKALLAIYADSKLPDNWRVMSAKYLRRALDEGQRISKADAATIAHIGTN
jgi:hypothetical protein